MPTSFGLIDGSGNIICGSGDFTVAQTSPNSFQLQFERDVRTAVVVATHHNPFCDGSGAEKPLEIGKPPADRNVVCVFFVQCQFSFILVDDCAVEQALGNSCGDDDN